MYWPPGKFSSVTALNVLLKIVISFTRSKQLRTFTARYFYIQPNKRTTTFDYLTDCNEKT